MNTQTEIEALRAELTAERQARAEAEKREALLRLNLDEWRDRWERTIRDQDVIRSENDALREQLDSVASAIGTTEYMDPPDGGNPTLAEQVSRMRADVLALRERCAEMERDRDRLDWLEQNMDRVVAIEDDEELVYRVDWRETETRFDEDLRKAIDAARQEGRSDA